jgi:hypothetical protein
MNGINKSHYLKKYDLNEIIHNFNYRNIIFFSFPYMICFDDDIKEIRIINLNKGTKKIIFIGNYNKYMNASFIKDENEIFFMIYNEINMKFSVVRIDIRGELFYSETNEIIIFDKSVGGFSSFNYIGDNKFFVVCRDYYSINYRIGIIFSYIPYFNYETFFVNKIDSILYYRNIGHLVHDISDQFYEEIDLLSEEEECLSSPDEYEGEKEYLNKFTFDIVSCNFIETKIFNIKSNIILFTKDIDDLTRDSIINIYIFKNEKFVLIFSKEFDIGYPDISCMYPHYDDENSLIAFIYNSQDDFQFALENYSLKKIEIKFNFSEEVSVECIISAYEEETKPIYFRKDYHVKILTSSCLNNALKTVPKYLYINTFNDRTHKYNKNKEFKEVVILFFLCKNRTKYILPTEIDLIIFDYLYIEYMKVIKCF